MGRDSRRTAHRLVPYSYLCTSSDEGMGVRVREQLVGLWTTELNLALVSPGQLGGRGTRQGTRKESEATRPKAAREDAMAQAQVCYSSSKLWTLQHNTLGMYLRPRTIAREMPAHVPFRSGYLLYSVLKAMLPTYVQIAGARLLSNGQKAKQSRVMKREDWKPSRDKRK